MTAAGAPFLPVTRDDLAARGWDAVDFLLISGDAYVDHPSFAAALIGRSLEARGYRVGICPQPDWRGDADFLRLGRPRLAVLVSPGNLDSMVAHFSVEKRRRKRDDYSPGGVAGRRPDRAALVYCAKARGLFRGLPVILGGIEASLRRFAHYDYWEDAVRRSILFDAKADLLVYGMGERAIGEIADRLAAGHPVRALTDVRGTCYAAPGAATVENAVAIPGYEAVAADRAAFARAFMIQFEEQDPVTGRPVVQPHGDRLLVQNPPALPLAESELDAVYGLPFARTWHPMYDAAGEPAVGGVPALTEVRYSVVSNRGCFGSCAFCSLHFHQGRIVQARGHDSILKEVAGFAREPGFKGIVHDVGGPTAQFRRPACDRQLTRGACRDRACLHPAPCRHLVVDHSDYLDLLRKVRKVQGVRKVFVRSGIRFDYLMADPNPDFFRELVEHHVSGQLKVAPEHVADRVLDLMGKPRHGVYRRFVERFVGLCRELGKDQYLVPYLISSHPGATLDDAIRLAEYLRDLKHTPEQVQDFYPTPGTLSTCMYHTGLDPRTMKPVYVPRTAEEKAMQRALLQYRKPENRKRVLAALRKARRLDLIGRGPKCLVADDKGK